MPTQPPISAATDERSTHQRWSSLSLCAFVALATVALGCEEERRRPPPADPAAAVAVPDGPDPVLERWDLVGENPKFVPLKGLFAAYEQAKFEELANPMLSNLVDFAERPVIEQRPAELGPGVAVATGPATDETPEAVDDVRTRDPLATYRLIILMTGISRPKAVVTDGKMNRIVLERGDPIGSEGGRVRAILQYKVLIGMPGKADPVELSIEPPLASLVNEGAPATERKDL